VKNECHKIAIRLSLPKHVVPNMNRRFKTRDQQPREAVGMCRVRRCDRHRPASVDRDRGRENVFHALPTIEHFATFSELDRHLSAGRELKRGVILFRFHNKRYLPCGG
jgi:hypothetical protein